MTLTDNDQIKNKCPRFSVCACEATIDPTSSEWPELSKRLIPKAVIENKTTMDSKCNNNLLLESESELEAQKWQLPFPENIDPEPQWRRVSVPRVSLKHGGAGGAEMVTGWESSIPVYTMESFISCKPAQAIQAVHLNIYFFRCNLSIVLAVNNSVYHGKFDVIFVFNK